MNKVRKLKCELCKLRREFFFCGKCFEKKLHENKKEEIISSLKIEIDTLRNDLTIIVSENFDKLIDNQSILEYKKKYEYSLKKLTKKKEYIKQCDFSLKKKNLEYEIVRKIQLLQNLKYQIHNFKKELEKKNNNIIENRKKIEKLEKNLM